jgi:hypothetical protein
MAFNIELLNIYKKDDFNKDVVSSTISKVISQYLENPDIDITQYMRNPEKPGISNKNLNFIFSIVLTE